MPNVAVVPTLDVSYSMDSVMTLVIIDSKAFVRSGKPGDEFAVVSFSDAAQMVYPTKQNLVTIDPQLTETAAAATAIGKLDSLDNTNMVAGITLAANLVATASLPTKAIMLLSDGMANMGGDPTSALPKDIPIFICGLGSSISKTYFDPMIAKNPASKYYPSPNAYQMMQVFNDIRGLSPSTARLANAVQSYSGTDYAITPVTVAANAPSAQLSVVWTDPTFKYSNGPPGPTAINIDLIEPKTGNTYPNDPDIVGEGFVIYNLENPQPGEWNILVQYAVNQIWGTSAGFEFNGTINMDVTAPDAVRAGEPIRLDVKVTDGDRDVDQLESHAVVIRPEVSVQQVKHRYADVLAAIEPFDDITEGTEPDDTARLETLRRRLLPNYDILPSRRQYVSAGLSRGSTTQLEIRDTAVPGSYQVQVNVKGYSSVSKTSFMRTKLLGVHVEVPAESG